VEQLSKEGYLNKIQHYDHNVGQCDRCSTIVEPKISIQWYLKVDTLAKPAIEAVESGRIQFMPDSFKKRYFEWMYNIHDWCISRQLWWGHRIPAWYCDACDKIVVSREIPEKCPDCEGALREESDILDTWFSSALWPFSTLGWPENTADLKTFYPTDVLITGPDIIFFWVARMIMMGLKFTGDIPFARVHINGIVRDASRKKMSKTRGNIIEPLQLIDSYGADAVRFTLSSMAVPGTDIPFSSDRMKGYSAFANKVWNAARFVLMNLRDTDTSVDPETVDELVRHKSGEFPLEDLWILHRLNQVSEQISESLDKFRFHEASALIYQFLWHEFCDWYIELVKPVLTNAAVSDREREPRVKILLHAMDFALRMLHPFMPFITEEIWQKLPHDGDSIMVKEFPSARRVRENPQAAQEMQDLMDLIGSIRSLRAEMNIDPKKSLDAKIVVHNSDQRNLISENMKKVRALAGLKSTEFCDSTSGNLLRGVSRLGEFGLDVKDAINVESERLRLQKEIARVKKEIDKVWKKLNSQEFLSRAPRNIVSENRARHNELLERYQKLESNLNHLPLQ
jgi:valyl-tRNA synthetase